MTPLERWKEIEIIYAAGYQRGLTEGGLWGLGCGLATGVVIYLLFFVAT